MCIRDRPFPFFTIELRVSRLRKPEVKEKVCSSVHRFSSEEKCTRFCWPIGMLMSEKEGISFEERENELILISDRES